MKITVKNKDRPEHPGALPLNPREYVFCELTSYSQRFVCKYRSEGAASRPDRAANRNYAKIAFARVAKLRDFGLVKSAGSRRVK